MSWNRFFGVMFGGFLIFLGMLLIEYLILHPELPQFLGYVVFGAMMFLFVVLWRATDPRHY